MGSHYYINTHWILADFDPILIILRCAVDIVVSLDSKPEVGRMYMYSLISLYLGGKMRGREIVGREILKPTKPQLNKPPPPTD